MTTATYMELEQENSRLRSELVDLRADYVAEVRKFACVAGMIGFEPDRSVDEIERVIQVKLADVPRLDRATIQAAAKWCEDYWRGIFRDGGIEGVLIAKYGPKTESSWTICAHEGRAIIEAIRRREPEKAGE